MLQLLDHHQLTKEDLNLHFVVLGHLHIHHQPFWMIIKRGWERVKKELQLYLDLTETQWDQLVHKDILNKVFSNYLNPEEVGKHLLTHTTNQVLPKWKIEQIHITRYHNIQSTIQLLSVVTQPAKAQPPTLDHPNTEQLTPVCEVIHTLQLRWCDKALLILKHD